MSILLKNIAIINAMQSINELVNLNLPIKASWNIAKNTKKIESAFNTFAECENQLIQKYAIKDENGEVKVDENNQYKIAPKLVGKFNEERSELLSCDSDIDILKVNLSDLIGDDNENKIKPSTLFNLYFMINEDEE